MQPIRSKTIRRLYGRYAFRSLSHPVSSGYKAMPIHSVHHSFQMINFRELSSSSSSSSSSFSSSSKIIHSTNHQDSDAMTNFMPEAVYHRIADDTLDSISELLVTLEESDELDDVDIECSMGVLNIRLGPSLGTWVINKQTPNRQLWWSSPISGPRRYELVVQSKINKDDDKEIAIEINHDELTAMAESGIFQEVDAASYWHFTKGLESTKSLESENLLQTLREEMKIATGIDI